MTSQFLTTIHQLLRVHVTLLRSAILTQEGAFGGLNVGFQSHVFLFEFGEPMEGHLVIASDLLKLTTSFVRLTKHTVKNKDIKYIHTNCTLHPGWCLSVKYDDFMKLTVFKDVSRFSISSLIWRWLEGHPVSKNLLQNPSICNRLMVPGPLVVKLTLVKCHQRLVVYPGANNHPIPA